MWRGFSFLQKFHLNFQQHWNVRVNEIEKAKKDLNELIFLAWRVRFLN